LSATQRAVPTRAPAYEAIARALLDAGVERAFGLMGEDTARLTTYLGTRTSVEYYGARHESMAVAMADGYSRLSGTLGVAILSRGPGLVNGLTAAVAARKHGTPLLIVAGDSPAGERLAKVGARYPKHVPQADILRACGLESETARDAADVPRAVASAIARARCGAVVGLNIPTDLFGAEVEIPTLPPPAASAAQVPVREDELAAAARLLAGSGKPILLAGWGAVLSGARPAIDALAARAGALTATSLLAKDLFYKSEFDVGVAGGFAGDTTRTLLADADLVISFGASLTAFTTAGGALFPAAKIVHVDVDPGQIGLVTSVDLGVTGDARIVAERLLERIPQSPGLRTAEVRGALAADRERADFVEESLPGALDPRMVLRAIDRALPADRNLVVDAGAFSGFASRYISVPDPTRFAFCLDFSAVGLGHGTALGAALAHPERTTALCIGDGGLMLTLGELETAQRCGIPLVVVCLDDGAYGAERHYLDIAGLPIAQSLFGMADFAGVAGALGLDALVVFEHADLERIEPAVSERRGPLLIDCKINGWLRPRWLEELYTSSGYGR
jgi:thiamine pyrophosphate-dependent acetolactate synthase large subunit-like protein